MLEAGLILLLPLLSDCANIVIEKNTFETDLNGWGVEKDSWSRRSVENLTKEFKGFPHPPDSASSVRAYFHCCGVVCRYITYCLNTYGRKLRLLELTSKLIDFS